MAYKRILIVEDNNIVAQDIQKRLEKLGYQVSSKARSATEAIQSAMEHRPDLVLMDIKLRGEMDGVEAAGFIREHFDIPVVYLTAYADDKTLSRAKITAPFGYIIKPFDENALHTNVEIGLFKHHVERELRESKRWLAAILQCIGDAAIATDADGRVRFMNRLAEQLTGWTEGEAFERHWGDVVDITTEDGRRAVVIASLGRDTETVTQCEDLVLRSKDGSELSVELEISPIVDGSGFKLGTVSVFRDVSERRVTEKARDQSRHLLQLVLDGVSDAIFFKSLTGHYILVNRAATALIGMSEEAVIGKQDLDLFGPGTAHLMARGHAQALSSGRVQTFECIVTRDGEERSLLMSESVCRNDSGRAVGVVAIGRDITEVKVGRRPLHQREKLATTSRAVGVLAHEMDRALSGIQESFVAIKGIAAKRAEYGRHVDEIETELAHISEIARQMSNLYWHSRNCVTRR